MRELEAKHNLCRTICDQGSAGASTPKTTVWISDSALHAHLQSMLGTLPVAAPSGVSSVGFHDNGQSRAVALERYPPQIMFLLGQVHAKVHAEKSHVHATATDTVTISTAVTSTAAELAIENHAPPTSTPSTDVGPRRVHFEQESVPSAPQFATHEEQTVQIESAPSVERAQQFEINHPVGSRVRVKWG